MSSDLLFSNFLRCCDNVPDRLALLYKGDGISYAELGRNVNRIANLVAHRVQNKVGPVAVFLDDALQQVVSIIGVSVSGHPFVPVNTSWPSQRIERALAKIQPVAIISDDVNCMKVKNFNEEKEVPIISTIN